MKRMENGLIDGLEYVKDEKTGKINWLKMIPEEYLYINHDKKSQIEKRLNKPFADIQIRELQDTDLVITLQGIRWLLDTRGYKQVKMKIDVATPEYAAATCEITFIPNEEENFEQIFPGSASAHQNNTKSFYRNYLVEAASNRALCRATRNFLRLNVVSKEELADANLIEEEISRPNIPNSPDPKVVLLTIMGNKGITFAKLKTKMIKEKFDGAENFNGVDDIPKKMIFEILDLINQKG